MDFEGFNSYEFEMELEEVEVKKAGKFQRVWSATEGGSIVRTTLAGDRLYWGAFDGYVYALDIRSGEIIWKNKIGNLLDSSPIFYDGFLYIGGERNGHIFCLDPQDGRIVWKNRMGGPSAGYVGAMDGKVFSSCRDSYFYAFDSKTGDLLWRFRTGDEVCCAPGFYKGSVIFGSFDGYAYCLDLKTGKEKWRLKTGGEIFCPVHLTVHENIVFVPSFDSYLYAIDARTGNVLWKKKLGDYGVAISPTIHESRIYVGARDGNFYCLDMDGKELWKFKTGSVIESRAVIQNERIYFGSEDNNFYCLDMNGHDIWRFQTDGEIWDEAKIFGEKMIFGGTDCRVHFLNLETGKEIWNVQTSTLRKSVWQGPYEMFRVEVKKESHFEDAVSEDKYKSRNGEIVSLSDYQIESEYTTTSDYKAKSDYDVNWVIFEDVEIKEALEWASHSGGLTSSFRGSM